MAGTICCLRLEQAVAGTIVCFLLLAQADKGIAIGFFFIAAAITWLVLVVKGSFFLCVQQLLRHSFALRLRDVDRV